MDILVEGLVRFRIDKSNLRVGVFRGGQPSFGDEPRTCILSRELGGRYGEAVTVWSI